MSPHSRPLHCFSLLGRFFPIRRSSWYVMARFPTLLHTVSVRFNVWRYAQLLIGHYQGVWNNIYFSTATTITGFVEGQQRKQKWEEVMSTLCMNGRLKEALGILDQMNQEGILAEYSSYVCLLRGCIDHKALAEGKQVHHCIMKNGFIPDIFLENTLIIMYASCGSVAHAWQVFDKMPKRNVVSWNVMISGYVQHGNAEEALKLFWQMQQEQVRASKITFLNILNACASLSSIGECRVLHSYIVNSGIHSNIIVGTAIINMYRKSGIVQHARWVFDRMYQRDVVTWTAMIATYAQNEFGMEAFKLFLQMQREGLKPNRVTFLSILDAFASPGSLTEGKLTHAYIVHSQLDSDVAVGTVLVKMYARCGSIGDACQVFHKMHNRDVISWNAMIAVCVQYGCGKMALEFFQQMQHEGMDMNQVTVALVLSACASLGSLAQCKQIHTCIVEIGIESDLVVSTALVNMYSKCGSIDYARDVFDKMYERDVVSWNAMITACGQHGLGKEAFKYFQQMQWEGLKLNQSSYTSILSACVSIAGLEQGKQVHAHIVESGFESDVMVGNSLVDMYAKCGSLDDAYQLFDKMNRRDIATWNTLITACGQHGHGKKALSFFQQMQLEGLKPNPVTCTSVLSACSHAGMIDEGCQFFDIMIQDYGITPTMDHYSCVVDLLCRAGCLDEAENFANKMPFQPSVVVWMTLLGAFRIQGYVELGQHAAECVLELDPKNTAAYVVLSNIYATAGRWDDKSKVRKEMTDRGLKKEPGCSWIEVNNTVHAFVAEDRSHPQAEEIYAKLESLAELMKEAGYVPGMSSMLHNVKEEKGGPFCHHSEKLAIAFGLINAPPTMPLRIIKNLRICSDCHIAIKFISKLVLRDILVRDATRFHCIEDGVCSCGDYW